MRSSTHHALARGTAAACALALVLAACSSSDGDGSGPGPTVAEQAASNAGEPSTSSSPTSTSREEAAPAPRAFVTATSLEPLVTTTTPPTTDPSTVALDELAVGDCVDLPGLGADESVEVGTARVRSCDEPHAAEVYAVVSLNDDPSAPYPGDEAVVVAADQSCLSAFTPYVGSDYVDSTLEIVHLRPDQAVWVRGDRTVRCAVHDRGLEPLVGSVEGSGR